MPRNIPASMVDQYAGSARTLCRLLKIYPSGMAPYGVTSLDVDVLFDDGDGPLTYSAAVGVNVSTTQTSSDLDVSNAEAEMLFPEYDVPVSLEDVVAGALDFAKFRLYEVDYTDLSSGDYVLLSSGTLGQAKPAQNGSHFFSELRGLSQNLKQSITEKWSLMCRATFGSQSAGEYFRELEVTNGEFTANANGWTLADAGNASVSWSSSEGFSTPGCIRVQGSSMLPGHGTVTSGIYPTTPGITISARAVARAIPVPLAGARGKSWLSIIWVDGGGSPVGSPADGAVLNHEGNDGWMMPSVRAVAPAGASGFRIQIHGETGVGFLGGASMYLDNVRCSYSDPSIAPPAGARTERFPCSYDDTLLWQPGTVETVGLESSVTFTTSGLSPVFGGNPGKVRWLTGRNAGREYEVDTFEDDSGGQTVGLTFPTMFPVEAGDTFEFRDDCPKTKAACKARNNWANFRGEPNIPVGDAGQASVPGASAGIGTGGRLTGESREEQ